MNNCACPDALTGNCLRTLAGINTLLPQLKVHIALPKMLLLFWEPMLTMISPLGSGQVKVGLRLWDALKTAPVIPLLVTLSNAGSARVTGPNATTSAPPAPDSE